jgi:hypothetical protein
LKRTEIWANGGGTQSAAIACLIRDGILPKPDLAVIADTGYEVATTWRFLDTYIAPMLREVGVEVHRVPSAKYATVGIWGGKDGNTLLMPAFTTQSGEIGKLPALCSNEWKLRVIQRWANKEHGVKAATFWMGMSTDELQRVKFPKGKWEKSYPLIDLRKNRGDCVATVLKRLGVLPPRSRCKHCPNQHQREWRELEPAEMTFSINFDKNLRKRDPHVWLHHEAKPLDEVDLSDHNEALFGYCDSGLCFV